jgi:hypothetical protein
MSDMLHIFRVSSPVEYKGRKWKVDTIILIKTKELARFLLGSTKTLNFVEPSSSLERLDNLKLRKRILKLTPREAEDLGISKSTLHYLRKNSRLKKSFKIYSNIASKLQIAYVRGDQNDPKRMPIKNTNRVKRDEIFTTFPLIVAHLAKLLDAIFSNNHKSDVLYERVKLVFTSPAYNKYSSCCSGN